MKQKMSPKMPTRSSSTSSKFSAKVAAIFIFNFLVGVGPLALPAMIARAGVVSGVICLLVVAFLAFVSFTFIVEVLSTANAWIKSSSAIRSSKVLQLSGKLDQSSSTVISKLEENKLYTSKDKNYSLMFEIEEPVELGLMAELFLGSVGSTLFYAVLCLYLYGDLAIFAVSIATTLESVLGGNHFMSYYTFLWGFITIIGPFCFFNFQNTKMLQLVTMVLRNSAMVLMIAVTILDIASGNKVPMEQLVLYDAEGTKELLGMAVFAYMCHHSIPSLILPLEDKKKTTLVTMCVYPVVFVFHSLLVVTASINRPASEISALYTLNFSEYPVKPLATFLSLYPAFTLSSNFPLICITLRNNLQTLFNTKTSRFGQPIFSLIAVVPPMIVAVLVRDVRKLVILTGSFAGLAIMFIAPALLVYFSRARLNQTIGPHWTKLHPHQSPFRHRLWIYLILVFALLVLSTKIF